MVNYWDAQNILWIYLTNDILGQPFHSNPINSIIYKIHMEVCLFHNGSGGFIPWFHKYNNWDAENIVGIHLDNNNLGQPFHPSPIHSIIYKIHMEICLIPCGFGWFIIWFKMVNYRNAHNIVRIPLTKDMLGQPFHLQPNPFTYL